jgi:hypothetical protein
LHTARRNLLSRASGVSVHHGPASMNCSHTDERFARVVTRRWADPSPCGSGLALVDAAGTVKGRARDVVAPLAAPRVAILSRDVGNAADEAARDGTMLAGSEASSMTGNSVPPALTGAAARVQTGAAVVQVNLGTLATPLRMSRCVAGTLLRHSCTCERCVVRKSVLILRVPAHNPIVSKFQGQSLPEECTRFELSHDRKPQRRARRHSFAVGNSRSRKRGHSHARTKTNVGIKYNCVLAEHQAIEHIAGKQRMPPATYTCKPQHAPSFLFVTGHTPLPLFTNNYI